jgi:hypothetical protein
LSRVHPPRRLPPRLPYPRVVTRKPGYKLQVDGLYIARTSPGQQVSRVSIDRGGYVYELVNPDSQAVVHVGQSANIERRVNDHLREALSSNELYDWLRNEIEEGKRPIVRVVDHASTKSELNRLGRERINGYVESGVSLFNKTWNSKATRAGQLLNIIEEVK